MTQVAKSNDPLNDTNQHETNTKRLSVSVIDLPDFNRAAVFRMRVVSWIGLFANRSDTDQIKLAGRRA